MMAKMMEEKREEGDSNYFLKKALAWLLQHFGHCHEINMYSHSRKTLSFFKDFSVYLSLRIFRKPPRLSIRFYHPHNKHHPSMS